MTELRAQRLSDEWCLVPTAKLGALLASHAQLAREARRVYVDRAVVHELADVARSGRPAQLDELVSVATAAKLLSEREGRPVTARAVIGRARHSRGVDRVELVARGRSLFLARSDVERLRRG